MSPASPMNRSRLAYALAALGIIALGLLWRRPDLGLSPVLPKYGGSVLWGVMVFCIVGALVPAAGRGTIALIAGLVAATVEFSQLLQVDWLDDIRRTRIGQLVLGRTFAWADIAAYWIGIAAALGIAGLVRPTSPVPRA